MVTKDKADANSKVLVLDEGQKVRLKQMVSFAVSKGDYNLLEDALVRDIGSKSVQGALALAGIKDALKKEYAQRDPIAKEFAFAIDSNDASTLVAMRPRVSEDVQIIIDGIVDTVSSRPTRRFEPDTYNLG